jgi:hypothetical protein
VSYNKKVIGVVKEWELRLEGLKAALAEESNQKHKLLMKEEVSALTYYCSELDGKLENMGLLIEVHGKMHEIICQASRSELEKTTREEQLIATLRERDQEVADGRLRSRKSATAASSLTSTPSPPRATANSRCGAANCKPYSFRTDPTPIYVLTVFD